MKRIGIVLVFTFMVFVLTSCGEKKIKDDVYNDTDEVNVVSPMKDYNTLTEMSTAIGFTVIEPKTLNDANLVKDFSTIDMKIAQVMYNQNGERYATYRMAKDVSQDEISGIYMTYETVLTMTGDIPAKLQGNIDKFYLATWEKDGYTHSVYLDNGATQQEIENCVKSVY